MDYITIWKPPNSIINSESFKKKIIEAANSFSIDSIELIEKLGVRQTIAGQEDQIITTATEIKNDKSKS